MPEVTEGEKVIGDFYKKPTPKEILRETIDFLDDVSYKFALFSDGFKRYLKAGGFLDETRQVAGESTKNKG